MTDYERGYRAGIEAAVRLNCGAAGRGYTDLMVENAIRALSPAAPDAPPEARTGGACERCGNPLAHHLNGRCVDARDEAPLERLPDCKNYSPPWFAGRWRDWHRGHGCNLDDGKPRSEQGAAEIAKGDAK